MGRRFIKLASLLMVLIPAATSFASGSSYEGSGASVIHDPAEGFQHLWDEMLIDITVIGIIFSAITIYFLIRYRRRHPDQEGKPVKLSTAQVFGWAMIPVFVFMADDFFLAARGWTLWNQYRQVPENSYEVQLESGMWSWTFRYPGGVESFNEMRVPAGRPVVVRMQSRDVVHSMYLPDFKVKEDSMPGRVTYLWFYPKEPGEHLITCAEYCGMLHSSMHGKVIAMPEEEFNAWLAEEQAKVNEGGA